MKQKIYFFIDLSEKNFSVDVTLSEHSIFDILVFTEAVCKWLGLKKRAFAAVMSLQYCVTCGGVRTFETTTIIFSCSVEVESSYVALYS